MKCFHKRPSGTAYFSLNGELKWLTEHTTNDFHKIFHPTECCQLRSSPKNSTGIFRKFWFWKSRTKTFALFSILGVSWKFCCLCKNQGLQLKYPSTVRNLSDNALMKEVKPNFMEKYESEHRDFKIIILWTFWTLSIPRSMNLLLKNLT